LGANTGYYSEKLTVRDFAKNYVMVEANPANVEILQRRWGDNKWKEVWFTKQAPHKGPAPEFEIVNQALSNHSKGELDMCLTEEGMKEGTHGNCKVSIASLDDIISDKRLSKDFQSHFSKAQSAFIKIDTEGMDELVLRGTSKLLKEKRGQYKDGSPRYLVNFFQFEWSPSLSQIAKDREGFSDYDIKSATQFLESIGFETFLIGPRFLPLSHGSWDDEFIQFTNDKKNNAGAHANYPNFDDRICGGCADWPTESATFDIFAVRSSHPQTEQLKLALGACKESNDFDMKDPQYSFAELQDSS
jgi:FkbM family methyltransferase